MSLAEQIIYDNEKNIIQAIQSGANINEHDRFGFRPLIQSIICKKSRVLQCLLEYGAEIEQIDILGRTPLQWACDRGEYEFSKLLLKYGANPNHYSADGQPILVNPILREQLSIVKLLMHYNANEQFAQDFISAKLLGHRFELVGETDIVSTNGKFIALSFEGFYLEFSIGLIKRSLNNFINSIPGQKFEKYFGKLNKIIKVMKNASALAEYSIHKDKSPFEKNIDSILNNNLLLLPAAYQGHAITFIQYGNIWAKCDRGVGKVADTVTISKIGNPYALTKKFLKKILYESKTDDFINKEIKQELDLKTMRTLPTKSQISGNCSWANVETSVPAMLFILGFRSTTADRIELGNMQKSIYKFYSSWVEWDKDSALDEALEDFTIADDVRKISKAIMLGSILTQRCHPNNKKHLSRAKKILSVLTQPNYQFILKNYRNIYLRDHAEQIGLDLTTLFQQCNLDLNKLILETPVNYTQANVHPEHLVKMTTALHVACLTGKIELVKHLVEKINIDVNYLDRTGSTALMYAAWKGFFEIVKYLIEQKNADSHVKNLKGGSAIRYAAYGNHKEIVSYLSLL